MKTIKTLSKDIEKLTERKMRQYYLSAGAQSVMIEDMPDEIFQSLINKFEDEARQEIVLQLPEDALFALRSLQPTLCKIKSGTKCFFNIQLFKDWGLIKSRVDVDGWDIFYLTDFGELICSLNLNI